MGWDGVRRGGGGGGGGECQRKIVTIFKVVCTCTSKKAVTSWQQTFLACLSLDSS